MPSTSIETTQQVTVPSKPESVLRLLASPGTGDPANALFDGEVEDDPGVPDDESEVTPGSSDGKPVSNPDGGFGSNLPDPEDR
jgi:hypothetical protein